MAVTYTLLFLLAALWSLALTPVARLLAMRIGAIDFPDPRRVHREATPRLGGLALWGSVVLTFVTVAIFDGGAVEALSRFGRHLGPLALGATIVIGLGIADDLRSLSPGAKLMLQLVAASIVVGSGFVVGNVLGVDLGWLGVPLTLLWVVGVTNAVNLIDGLDGLAAGVGLIVSLTIFAVSVSSGRPGEAMVLVTLAGALAGFLRYNFHPARIFLGDSGSLFLGFVLAVVSIVGSSKPETAVAFAVPILALGLPIADTLLALLRRVLRAIHVVRSDPEGEHYEFLFLGKAAVFTADRDHIHHRLLGLGISHRRTVLVLYGVCVLFGAGAFALVFVREPNQGFLLAAFAIAAVVSIHRLNYGELRVLRRGMFLPIFDLPVVSWRLLHVPADLGFVLLAYFGAFWIASQGQWTPELRSQCIGSIPLVALVQISTLAATGVYRVSFRVVVVDDLLAVYRGVLLTVAAGWLAQSVALGFEFPRLDVALLDAYLLGTFVIGSRVLFPILEHVSTRDRDAGRRVLIYGTGRSAIAALHEIEGDASLDRKVEGFVDDERANGARVVGGRRIFSTDEVYDLALRRRFDELVVAHPRADEDLLDDLARIGTVVRRRRSSIRWENLDPSGAARREWLARRKPAPAPAIPHRVPSGVLTPQPLRRAPNR